MYFAATQVVNHCNFHCKKLVIRRKFHISESKIVAFRCIYFEKICNWLQRKFWVATNFNFQLATKYKALDKTRKFNGKIFQSTSFSMTISSASSSSPPTFASKANSSRPEQILLGWKVKFPVIFQNFQNFNQMRKIYWPVRPLTWPALAFFDFAFSSSSRFAFFSARFFAFHFLHVQN